MIPAVGLCLSFNSNFLIFSAGLCIRVLRTIALTLWLYNMEDSPLYKMHHRDQIHRDTPAVVKMETHDHTTTRPKKRGKSLKIESVKIA
jgi:hypothetical protein